VKEILEKAKGKGKVGKTATLLDAIT